MLNTRWLMGLILVVSSTFPACTTRTSLGRDSEDGGAEKRDTSRITQPATGCTYQPTQVDLSCNDDPSLPRAAGICETNGTCTCSPGFVLNPTSKRCKLDPATDAGVLICTVGADQTCNDDLNVSMITGTCVGGVACACKTGYRLNPATGKCRFVPENDAGVTAGVCTFLLDQTCNDDDLYSGTAGVCSKQATCACNNGFVLNPVTGRCRSEPRPDAAIASDGSLGKDSSGAAEDAPVAKDAGKDVPGVCTYGMNRTCNDSPVASWTAGFCQSDETCVCGNDYVLNPSSGRCALAPRDGGVDLAPDANAVCTPGMDQTCNDDPASALSGTCQANGTCSCNGGYVLNPSTGKCLLPAAGACSGSYDACGCGCCGGMTPAPVCYYPSAGESISAIKAADEAAAASPTCAAAGCSMKRRYLCCAEAAAEPAGSAQYSASYMVGGGYDRIGLMKTGSDGKCFSLTFRNPGSMTSWRTFRLDVPTNWGLDDSVYADGCSSMASEQTIGIQGSITFTPNGTSCALNAHMTLFSYDAKLGTVSPMRIDADNLPISGGPNGYCQ